MADVALEEVLDRIRLEVPQCPRELMQSELVRVVRDFCQYTRAWQFEVDDESILQLVSDYDIEVTDPAKAQPIAVEYLTVDGVKSRFKEVKWLDDNMTGWRTRAADDFRFFTQIQPKVITFPCVPTKNGTVGGLRYRVSMKPPLTATVLDSDFLNEWQDILQDATKGHLMLMDGKPWYKPKRAETLLVPYSRARTQARIRVDRSYGNPEQSAIGGARFA